MAESFALDVTQRETLQITKLDTDAREAKKQADAEYNVFFDQWWKYITRSTHHILNEFHGIERKVGYLIRIEFAAPASIMQEMKQWVAEHLQTEKGL